MRIRTDLLQEHNQRQHQWHQDSFETCQRTLTRQGIDVEGILKKLSAFQIAIPSWALGAGGTRFGRFSIGGEPGNLEQKLEDIGAIHALTRSAGAISLHIPWDIPGDAAHIRSLASELGIAFDAMNSNTFQDQPGQAYSYQFGSLCHADERVRRQAIEHNIEVIRYGEALGSTSITVWLADGSGFPGQHNFRRALLNTRQALEEIYAALPESWKLFLEYKPYEPNFYSMTVPDWGTSYSLVSALGPKAYTLVDLGHHLPNTNIEQIVSTLITYGKLGGFHFNDSKYSDDDLTTGSMKPYQLFLIFLELVWGLEHNIANNPSPAWMIDASHNLKDPLEDLMQSLEAIRLAYAQAMLVDQQALAEAQEQYDVAGAQEILQNAFRTDARPLLREARRRAGGAIDPLRTYRELGVREQLIRERGSKTTATGL